MKPILVIGRHGQVSQALKATQPDGYQVHYLGREALDIRDSQAIERVLDQQDYQLVINASGYTQVDAAETDSQAAFALNHLAVKALAEHCGKRDIRLIHISSDYVFDGVFEEVLDGQQRQPYRPTDRPNPLSRYGESKWHGEQAALEYGQGHACIVRTSWLYSPFGHNFVKTMLTLMRQGKPLKVVDDQWGTPTSAIALGQFIWQLIQVTKPEPIYHWSDLGVTSWFEFARRIADSAYALGLLDKPANISPISTQEYGAAAPRPRYSALDTSQSQAILPAKRWQDNLIQVLQQLAKEG
ncbi:dTDP-4-dehydrorhamnose reductase [Shewanella alkalitolerans]|uniref:dTDP-4-dehydrorhamnose reductase n=1 Tax=Shewanella alkalitolerans TaxID=2864209 RepID=UPI001C661AE2|nr:dTDP-4-dehydrorhamnose reductase [Shewanella alkalitolerans]QYJ97553.1 dTDP-4-dehydrorhamnose reductase [Shewanella alkalitolerans]